MIAYPCPLIEVFTMIPNFRKPRGKRHPLAAIFALACCAMLCGTRSYSAIAAWGRHDGVRLAQALGFTHATPCAATLHTIFCHVNRDAFEAYLGARPDQIEGAPGTHLSSALAHHRGVTLAQHAVDDKTNESTAVETIVPHLVLEGRIVRMDALLTQRHVAQTIVDKGGDSVMLVNANQPQLRADIDLVFTLPPVGDCQATARTVDSGHGRIEQRHLTTRAALMG
jgi:hypothetical protein